MHMKQPVKFTINIVDKSLDEEQRESVATSLYRQVQQAGGELGEAQRERQQAPSGAKSAGAWVLGLLTVWITREDIKAFFVFLFQRLASTSIEMSVEVDGKKIELKARTPSELQAALKAAETVLTAED